MSYCPICGNTGIKLDNTPCSCKINEETIFSNVVCIDIPEQYQGILFNKDLVPLDCGAAYPEFLQSVYDKITSFQMRHKNLLICSPAGHSKTILAYSIIQYLFRKKMPVVPLYDIMEIRRIMSDHDMGKGDATDLYSAPYLFAKIPQDTSFATYATIATLIDRRVRRGYSTILFFNGTWSQLIYGDSREILTGMLGDGHFGTIENKTWWKK